MNKIKNKIIIFMLLVLCSTSCGDDQKKKQEMIDTEVANALNSYRQRRKIECLTSVTDSANRIVDSLIRIKMTAYDTSLLSRKPQKPVKPVIKSPLDTTDVVPLLPK
jgi:thiamine biosynthesis lipoprotein ApbE